MFPRGDRFNQMSHQIDIASPCEGDMVVQIPDSAGEILQSLFQLWHERVMKEVESRCVVRRQIARRELCHGRLIGSDSRSVTDRQQRTERLHFVRLDGFYKEFNWNKRLR